MMKSILFPLIIILLLFTCCMSKENEYHPSRGEQLVKATLGRGAKIIKEKYGLLPSGSGVAMPGGPIQSLTLCFDTKYPHTKEQLRELLIKSSAELLRLVIENKEIYQFLKDKPFTIRNIEIIIYNNDINGLEVFDSDISVARTSQGKLIYRTTDIHDPFSYKNQYEESYEEALEAIGSQS